jgi:hypothetical protein
MKSITYIATVSNERKTTIALPDDIPPGVYTLRVYIEEQTPQISENPFQDAPTVRAWDRLKAVSLRRKDIYGDDGR